jgi:hypothetical protein
LDGADKLAASRACATREIGSFKLQRRSRLIVHGWGCDRDCSGIASVGFIPLNEDVSLTSLLYVSSATRHIPPDELATLLERSRRKNTSLGVTGMLLHKDGNFMQVLEGDATAVRQLFDMIGRDPRHAGVLVLRHVEQSTREFADWSMAFTDLNDPAARAVPGYSEFLNTPLTGREFTENPTIGQKLLLTFKRNLQLRSGD